uniref:Uncharacterized protein n=1 Tax=Anguilla anguilla TaxID=7936 RepID=A0A0E9SGM5_ANGAN
MAAWYTSAFVSYSRPPFSTICFLYFVFLSFFPHTLMAAGVISS